MESSYGTLHLTLIKDRRIPLRLLEERSYGSVAEGHHGMEGFLMGVSDAAQGALRSTGPSPRKLLKMRPRTQAQVTRITAFAHPSILSRRWLSTASRRAGQGCAIFHKARMWAMLLALQRLWACNINLPRTLLEVQAIGVVLLFFIAFLAVSWIAAKKRSEEIEAELQKAKGLLRQRERERDLAQR